MGTNFVITLANNEIKTITATSIGITQDGSLLIVMTDGMGQTTPIMGYAAGEWKSFYKSNVAIN